MSASATLAPSDGAAGFGLSIAASGDAVVVGAPIATAGRLAFAGKAYVFTKPGGGWSGVVFESAQLFASNPSAFASFGSAVAIDAVILGEAKELLDRPA